MINNWLYTSLIFILLGVSVSVKTCDQEDLRAVRNFYDIFNTNLRISETENPVKEVKFCEKFPNYEYKDQQYTGFRYATKGNKGELIYFVYEDRLIENEEGYEIRRMRLLQPWEEAYRNLIWFNKSAETEILDIIDLYNMYSNYIVSFFLSDMIGGRYNDLSKFKTEIKYFGNYADNWIRILGTEYLRIGILMIHFGMIQNTQEDYPFIKSQQLIKTVYHVENEKGTIVFACAVPISKATIDDLQILEMTGVYQKIKNKEISLMSQFSLI